MLHEEIEIAAAPEAVWALIGDVRNLSRWSPQVSSTRLSGGAEECAVGTRFTNRNEAGELTWTTHGQITAYDEGRRLAFRVEENYVVWSFELAPTADGTRLVQRRDEPDGVSQLSRDLIDGFMGGQEAFTVSMERGMRETLAGIKAEAEAWSPAASPSPIG